MYRATTVGNSYLQIPASPLFSFGTGDFTVMAMVVGGLQPMPQASVIGTGSATGGASGGFVLSVNSDGSFGFGGNDSSFDNNYYWMSSYPGLVSDSNCHVIAGVRSNGQWLLYLDGVQVPRGSWNENGARLFNINVTNPVYIGAWCPTSLGYTGAMMNVSVWNCALTDNEMVEAAFARIAGNEPNLVGYWDLNGNALDQSRNALNAQVVGQVDYSYCAECVWTHGNNSYAFCEISNRPGPNTPSATINLSKGLVVPAGAPLLTYSVMSEQDVPTFPEGMQVSLTAPNGQVYDQPQNSETVFAGFSGSQLWCLAVTDPPPGIWQLSVSAPGTTGFRLDLQTVPSAHVVLSSVQALEPLFPASASPEDELVETEFGAISRKLIGSAVAGMIALCIAEPLVPAVVLGYALEIFCGMVAYGVTEAWTLLNKTSRVQATYQLGGAAGYIQAQDKLLLFDADIPGDAATQSIAEERRRLLYADIRMSAYAHRTLHIKKEQVKYAAVHHALTTNFDTGYVSCSGHGQPKFLDGWFHSGTSGALEIVLNSTGTHKVGPEAGGKIFHLAACKCGWQFTGVDKNLAQYLVDMGAVAVFAYSDNFQISAQHIAAFCEPDIEIDIALLGGATCREALDRAKQKYEDNIAALLSDGYQGAAGQLRQMKERLSFFGNGDASLNVPKKPPREGHA